MTGATPEPVVALAGGADDPDRLRRRARTALVVNLVVALGLFGLLSVPGAVFAGLALRAARVDPGRADRLVRWSWAFLAANLLFYLLLAVVVGVVAGLVYLAHRAR